jgi:hypothetical protein
LRDSVVELNEDSIYARWRERPPPDRYDTAGGGSVSRAGLVTYQFEVGVLLQSYFVS